MPKMALTSSKRKSRIILKHSKDQIFKIDKIVTKRIGFEFEIKVKKDNVRVEESMKHIESFSGWPLQIKVKNISRLGLFPLSPYSFLSGSFLQGFPVSTNETRTQ